MVKYIKEIELSQFEAQLNNQIKTNYGISIQYGNSLCNIYLIDKEEYKTNYTVRQHLYSGSKTECWYYLKAILETLTYFVEET